MAPKFGFDVDTSALRKVQDDASGKLLKKAQQRITASAKSLSPVDTGALRGSHRPTPVKVTSAGGSAEIVAEQEYALMVHEGTRPHKIVPRRASVLSFKVGGRRVFAKSVNHPGTKGQPWLRTALDREGGRLGFVVTD